MANLKTEIGPGTEDRRPETEDRGRETRDRRPDVPSSVESSARRCTQISADQATLQCASASICVPFSTGDGGRETGDGRPRRCKSPPPSPLLSAIRQGFDAAYDYALFTAHLFTAHCTRDSIRQAEESFGFLQVLPCKPQPAQCLGLLLKAHRPLSLRVKPPATRSPERAHAAQSHRAWSR